MQLKDDIDKNTFWKSSLGCKTRENLQTYPVFDHRAAGLQHDDLGNQLDSVRFYDKALGNVILIHPCA